MSAGARVLLYSHDTYGLGHLRRNLAIAGALLSGLPGCQVLLATGSTVADRFRRPTGLQVVKLPPVIKTGVESYDSREPGIPLSLVRRARSAVLVDVVRRWRPDLILVDHSPQGMKGELLPVFEAVAELPRRPRLVLGLRDILDDPGHVRSLWEAEGVYKTLSAAYDRILVYGQKEIFDVAEAYGLGEEEKAKLSYCGYVATPSRPAALPPEAVPEQPFVLGTVVGGGDGVEVLVATLRAASTLGIGALLATGPLMSTADRATLEIALARNPGAKVVDMVDDVAHVASGAAFVVTRGGYNTLSELAAAQVPTVVIPRAWPRMEQLLRAAAFSTRGLVEMVDPIENADPDDLHRALIQAVGRLGAGVERPSFNLTGLHAVTLEVRDMVGAGSRSRWGGVGSPAAEIVTGRP